MPQATATLLTLDGALRLERTAIRDLHRAHLDPRLARLLELVGAGRLCLRAVGVHACGRDGVQYLDFLSGFGALSLGHNHPRVHQALDAVRQRPNLIEEPSALEAALAHNLALLAGGGLDRVHFACSGTEAVDAAIKLARAATGRVRLVACEKGFHGRSIGALSVTERAEYRAPFEPLLPGVTFVPFGDDQAL